jgi:hypothetical protein
MLCWSAATRSCDDGSFRNPRCAFADVDVDVGVDVGVDADRN